MKTTIEIPDPLMAQARAVAARDHTTVRALVESGLRRVVTEAEQQHGRTGFQLRRASFRGNGLQPTLRGASWETMRELAYEDRGG